MTASPQVAALVATAYAALDRARSAGAHVPTNGRLVALNALARPGSATSLAATRPNMPALCRDLVDWHGIPKGAATRATKPVVKALSVPLADDDRYPAAAEMAGFASVVAGLLDPDRLARVISAGLEQQNQSTVFSPLLYPGLTSKRLERLLGHYPQEVRERLLVSLWVSAHEDDRLGPGEAAPARQRRRHADDADAPRVDGEQLVDKAEHGDTTAALEVLLANTDLAAGNVPLRSAGLLRTLGQLRLSRADRRQVAVLAADPGHHPDLAVALAHVKGLWPLERPDSPVGAMIAALHDAVETALELSEDSPTVASVLPKKPATWDDLWDDLQGGDVLPVPRYMVSHWHNKVLPSGARTVIIRTDGALKANGQTMGNCTWSLHGTRCRAGEEIIGVWQRAGQAMHNFALMRGADGTWRVGEVNSRFNRGAEAGVREDIHQHLQAMITER